MTAGAEARPRLFLIDGYALIYRAFHAAGDRPLTNKRGEQTAIPWGIANFLDRLRRTRTPEYLGWVNDAGASARDELFADYKANRVALDESAQADFDRGVERVGQLLAAHGIPLLTLDGYEADDVIATLAKQGAAAGIDVVVVSPDKDLLQLVTPQVAVLNPYHGRPGATTEKTYTVENVAERLGVGAEQVVDYLAMVGDSADNVPGVKGIGEKGARDLLATWGSLEAIYANLDAITPARAQKALREGAADAALSKRLVTVQDALPIALDLDALRLSPLDVDALRRLYLELDFNTLLKGLATIGVAPGVGTTASALAPSEVEGNGAGAPVAAHEGTEAASSEPPPPADRARGAPIVLEAPRVDAPPPEPGDAPVYALVTTLDAVAHVIRRAREVPAIAIDTETVIDPESPFDVDPLRSRLVGLSICVAPGEGYYFPFAHRAYGAEGDLLGMVAPPTTSIAGRAIAAGAPAPVNLPAITSDAMAPLRALLADPGAKKTAQNAKYDLLVLRGAGVPLDGLDFDTMLASYLLDPGRRSHGLDTLALEFLAHEMTSYTALCGSGKTALPFDVVPLAEACAYSCEDVDMTLRLRALFTPQLDAKGAAALLHDVEVPLIGVLARMEWTGVAIDVPWFAQLKQRFSEERARLEREIHAAAGEEFNINSNPQLRRILFEKLGLPVKKKTATGPSTDASVLQELAEEGHQLPVLLMEYRELFKLENTYVDTLPQQLNPRDHRLHTSFQQAVAATGRLSSSDPNLQNIPVRKTLGRDIRRGFVPRAGWQFLSADYSQIELRLLAHLSHDPAFVEAFHAGGDIHKQTASIIFGVDIADVTSEMRARAKTINFGTIYGQGPFALARQLRIPQAEAKAFIEMYFTRFAGVKAFLEACVVRAKATGYAETLFGRRRYIPELTDRNHNIRAFGERVAANAPIQGSAADLIKVAMIRIDAALTARAMTSAMLLQVHDELVFEAPPDEIDALKALVVTEMTGAATLAVPLVVDVGVGSTWLDAKA
ncbi:MAG: DNA polymerase I [Gemmatimonadaceae bacterium]|jgi:DNA polymerase-1|nr:DNA polymerase I [Gemmatimonadaceae bacterium]